MHEDNAPVTSVRFSPNGKFVLAWTLDSCVRLWNYVDGKCIKTYQGHKNEKFSLAGAFGVYGGDDEDMATSAFVVSGSEDGRLLWWDVIYKSVLDVKEAHDGVVLGVDTREDGLIVTCGLDKLIKVWERGEPGVQEAVNSDVKMEDAEDGHVGSGGDMIPNGQSEREEHVAEVQT